MDLHSAIDKLDEKHRTVIILKYMQGYTLAETAQMLKWPIGTVKTYLHRALKQLKLELKEE